MKRNEFIKALGIIGIGTQFGTISCNSKQAKKLANNGLPDYRIWYRPKRENTNEEIRADFTDITAMGFKAVLPQIYSSSAGLFNLPNHEVKSLLLKRMIPIANQVGLELHAWMWTMPCNNSRIIKEHPDWYAVNRNRQSAHSQPAYVNYYEFLCPRKPKVRSFVAKRVRALATCHHTRLRRYTSGLCPSTRCHPRRRLTA